MPVTLKYLLALYFVSGIVSLSLEVLWARLMSIQFGVSVFGITVTVAAFMAGLGGGSVLGAKKAVESRSPLIVFAVLEAAVALYALLMPWITSVMSDWMIAWASESGLGVWYGVQSLLMLMLMLFPAMAMGYGYACVVESARRYSAGRFELGQLYGLNTLGGATGALLSVALLAAGGWKNAVYIIAFTGFAVAALATYLALTREGRIALLKKDHGRVEGGEKDFLKAALLYGLVGMAAMIIQIGWVRVFGMIMLRTEYVLALIVMVFLAGIAAGSLIERRLKDRKIISWLTACASLFTVLGIYLIRPISQWLETAEFPGLTTMMVVEGLILAAVTFPVTLALGIWYPALTRKYRNNRKSAAFIYGVNAIGACAGALLAGFFLIEFLGAALMLILAAMLIFVAGAYHVKSARLWLVMILLLVTAWPVRDFYSVNELLPEAMAGSSEKMVYEDSITLTHVIEGQDGQRLLLTDMRRMDASSDPTSVILQKNQARLPLLLSPDAGSILFLGLGTGISASGATEFNVGRIDTVELSEGAIIAAEHYFSKVNGNITDRVNVIKDDARRYLMATDQMYDVIVGDVFHPDLAGRSALLSIEQFVRVRERLNDNGMYVQWLALNQFDVPTLRIIMNTFASVFDDGHAFIDGFRLALVAKKGEPLSAGDVFSAYAAMANDMRAEVTAGEGINAWLGRYWGRIEVENNSRIQSELWPVIEFLIPGSKLDGGLSLESVLGWLIENRERPEQAAENLGAGKEKFAELERSIISNDLILRAWYAGLKGDQYEADRLTRYAYQADRKNLWAKMTLADGMMASLGKAIDKGIGEKDALKEVLKVMPGHIEAMYAMWRLEESDGNKDRAERYLSALRTQDPYSRRYTEESY